MTQHRPILSLIALLWAHTRLWPQHVLTLLLAAREAALAAGLDCPRAEHDSVIPDRSVLRTLAGVARPELRAHPEFGAVVEQLVGEVEMAEWTAPRSFAPTPADRAFLAYLAGLRARGGVYVLYLQACGEKVGYEARRRFRAALAADADLRALREVWLQAMAQAWHQEAA